MPIRPLVDRRQSEGLSVALVDIEDVQDEFASGEKSADARALVPLPCAHRLAAATPVPAPPRGGHLRPARLPRSRRRPRPQRGGADLGDLEAVSDSWFVGFPAQARSQHRTASGSDRRRDPVRWWRRFSAGARRPRVAEAARLRRAGTSDFPAMNAELRNALPDAPATVLVRGSDTDDGPARALPRRASGRAGTRQLHRPRRGDSSGPRPPAALRRRRRVRALRKSRPACGWT